MKVIYNLRLGHSAENPDEPFADRYRFLIRPCLRLPPEALLDGQMQQLGYGSDGRVDPSWAHSRGVLA